MCGWPFGSLRRKMLFLAKLAGSGTPFHPLRRPLPRRREFDVIFRSGNLTAGSKLSVNRGSSFGHREVLVFAAHP